MTSTAVKDPQISVVIPTLNGSGTIAACLDGIFQQTVRDKLEVIVVDSGSRDNTLEIVRRYPVSLLYIEPNEFNHGAVRNFGANHARGEFVVMTVQDARPVDEHWLERMLRHFDNPDVAGVCGQQVVPHESDKNPLQWFRPYSKPEPIKIYFKDGRGFEKLSSREQLVLCGWDDVTAMYRRNVLLQIPFQSVNFAEDLIWAKDALHAGNALIYDYSARVNHYHHETFGFRFRRTYTILFHQREYFGATAPMPGLLLELARAIYRSFRRKYLLEKRNKWLLYNVRLIMAERLALWIFHATLLVGGVRAITRLQLKFCGTPPRPAHNA